MPAVQEREYQVCSKCIMDTTDPDITFDDQGICHHCQYFDNNIMPNWFPNEEGAEKLEALVKEIKEYGKDQEYDCIIGLSGGVDSSYLAIKVVEWGLRPLVVHVDAGWNSELAVKNIEQIVTKLGLDLVTHVVDWEEMKDLQLAFLKSNVANQDVPQDHAFFAALYNYAVEAKIKYVINGSNFATEGILPQSWGYDAMDVKHLKSIHKVFGKKPLRTFPTVGFFKYHFFYPYFWKMQVVKPLNFIPYTKEGAIEVMERDYGWRYYGGKHFESRWTRFFQAYYLPSKFGYDKRLAHLSSLVVSGEMSRDEALSEMQKPAYDEKDVKEDKEFIAKKLGVTFDELEELIAQPNREFSEFPNNQKLAKTCYGLLQDFRTALARIQRAVFMTKAYINRIIYFAVAYTRRFLAYLVRLPIYGLGLARKAVVAVLSPIRKAIKKN